MLKHEKFHLFEAYASAIGIDKVPEVEGWAEHQVRLDKIEAAVAEEKRIAEEKKLKEQEEKLAKEKQDAIAKAAKMQKEFNKLINKMGVAKPVDKRTGRKAKAA